MSEQKATRRPMGIIIAAFLMIVFGLAEVVTSFRHEFFGISTSSAAVFTWSAAAIGAAYTGAGLLILIMKKRAAALAFALLAADVAGRIALTATGYYPTDSFKQTFSIIAGTAIAAVFAVYIAFRWKTFN